ncbi:MAG: energy transducer TonB [Nitrososphaera sp.]|nr:energy transducer TonB [Nitrososphaera sp.]
MKRISYAFIILLSLHQIVAALGTQQDPLDKENYLFAVEQLPAPIGGIRAIQEKVVYPESAKKDKIEGTVFVEVFLDEAGNVIRTSIVKGVRNDLDVAAQNAVRAIQYTPGKHQGKPVKVRMAIPLRFRLSDSPPPPPLGRSTILVVQGPQELSKTISYPEMAIRAGIQGEVVAQVTLDEQKQMTAMKISQGIGAGCDQAVLRALATYDFPRDYNYASMKSGQTITVVVRFLLPREK